MAGKVRHLVNRNGRYFARLVVPKDLRGIVGKTELRTALGADRREALKLLPGAVANLQHEIAVAERKAAPKQFSAVPARYPLAADQIALTHYMQRLAFDDELRMDPLWPSVMVDDHLVGLFKDAVAGHANDNQLEMLVGPLIEKFRRNGNTDAVKGSSEWRVVARALCVAELEALGRVIERDEGDFSGAPTLSPLVEAKLPEEEALPVSLKKLWIDYVASRKRVGSMRDGGMRQRPVIESLREFLKHDDASRITRKNVIEWRDHLMKTHAAKTVSDVYLSTVRSLLQWAYENERLSENVAATVRQQKPRKVATREKGYTDAEAVEVLKVSRAYRPMVDEFGRIRETPQMVATKQWVPILCAYTGARVSEITQLRKEDVRQVGDIWSIRITPDAGTVKSGGYRDVPLHAHILSEGFLEFVNDAPAGPLFHNAAKTEDYAAKAARVSNRLATWLRSEGLTPDKVQPNHGWRHRIKTQFRELDVAEVVYDALQGHTGKTASDNYGDVTLTTKLNAINKLPTYDLN